MHATDFGRTLIIANPAAQSGAAREVAERLQRFLDMTARASQFDLVLTERMGHAKELAAQAQGYRTVIALGGDGVIHEVVNGLMTQKEDARPALAVLPVGSGNDFAQTLGIDDFSGKDFGALLTCELQRQDIGRIRSWSPASGSGTSARSAESQTALPALCTAMPGACRMSGESAETKSSIESWRRDMPSVRSSMLTLLLPVCTAVNIIRALATACLLNDIRY